jgi:hypothetical protein
LNPSTLYRPYWDFSSVADFNDQIPDGIGAKNSGVKTGLPFQKVQFFFSD